MFYDSETSAAMAGEYPRKLGKYVLLKPMARSVLKQEHTAPGVVFGRASYLAPEQARGEVADARSDIYSLGIVMWELLTGNQYLQLANLDPATAMSLVRHPKVERPSTKAPWITKDLDTLLMRALAPTREQRFQSAEELRQALSDVIAKLAPRADVERAAAFVRSLYENAIRDERAERDRLLAEAQPLVESAMTPVPVLTADPRQPVASGTIGNTATIDRQVPLAELDHAKVPLTFPSEEEPAATNFAGRVVDHRYRVLRKIGEGGMGTVYVGEHIEIGKEVAIKILHPAFSTEKELVERFRREARAASRIGHPNIIDVTDFGTTDDGCAYFVMEYLDGIDLADVLTHERRLEHTRACQIAIQICRALGVAHAAGVVHRDLKPENIFLVSRDGKADFVKVLDFGIARSAGPSRQLTNPGVAMGTPEYMAPEQAMGGPVDRRSDIYSVGALLYEMVTGSAPVGRASELVAPRVLRNELPDEVDRTILRALEPDPERRYQTMAQLEYDIIKALWGRARAVNELLGLRVMRRRAETAPRTDTPISTEAIFDAQNGRVPGMTPAAALVPVERAGLTLERAEMSGLHAPERVAAPPPAPATDAERKAERVRAASAEIEKLLGSTPGFDELAGIVDALARLRADGSGPAADAFAARAAAGAHRLLADTLYDAHQDEEAVAEYEKARTGASDDKELARGLARASQRLASDRRREARHAARSAAGARAGGGAPDAPAPAGAGESGESGEAKSAPPEPTAEQ